MLRGGCIPGDNGIEVQVLHEPISLARGGRQARRPGAFLAQDPVDGREGGADVLTQAGQARGGNRLGKLLPDLSRESHQPGNTNSLHGVAPVPRKALTQRKP